VRGSVAIVTGGSRGIGAATAARLATDGWSVCLSYLSAADRALAVVERCLALGVDASAVSADVAEEADVEALFDAARSLGPIGALVNNAGIVDEVVRVDGMARDRIERMLAVNVVGPFLCAREAVRTMSTRYGGPGGVIVNVGSAASRVGSPGQYVDYAASKGAIDSFTLGLAKEVADEGIRVNVVRPGIVDTDIHASGGQPDKATTSAPAIPMQRAGRPDEVAEAIAWLCSDASSYVTGAFLDVSGGR
jgi:NAD(P)-dependent dehydrogenase (short-subunit alcohol dehydrogenase family)